jgi:uncharacterized membrane protein YfcA
MNSETLIIVFAAAVAGSAIATWTGFGAATILTPVLGSFMEIRQAILIVAIYHGIHNLVKMITFRKGIAGRVALLFGFGAVTFSLLGSMMSSLAPVSTLKLVLGGFLIFDAVLTFKGRTSRQASSPGVGRALAGGAFSGFTAGIIGTGGAVRALFLHHYVSGKDQYISTSALVALMIDASRIPVYVTQYPATTTSSILPIVMTAVTAGFLGIFAARAFLRNVSTERFQSVLLIALVLAGISFIVQGVKN